MLLRGLFLLTLLFLSPLQAMFVVPNDSYLLYQGKQLDMIYQKRDEMEALDYLQYAIPLLDHYAEEFDYSLQQKPTYALASLKNQIPNALSTVYPLNLNIYYPGGPFLLEQFASSSWIFSSLIHETAHLFQMEAQQDFGRMTQNIFGRHLFFIYPIVPLPLFMFPNLLLPTGLIEGHAVFNESRFHQGGRLFTGSARALLLQLCKHQRLTPKRFLNNHLQFPFGQEKYLVGGYFWSYLNQFYPAAKINQFFFYQSQHFFNPLIIDSSFEEHFGRGFWDLLDDFINATSTLAQFQQEGEGQSLVKAKFYTPLNRDQDHIFFILDQDRRSPKKLLIFDKRQKQLSSQDIDLPYGKLFKINDHYYSATSQPHRRGQEIITGLWDAQNQVRPDSLNRLYTDINGSHQAFIDLSQSVDRMMISSDGQHFQRTDSWGILDAQGNLYSFRQQQQQRVLYKNQTPLYRFPGYSSLLMDSDGDEILFLAPTKYGQSLFSYSQSTKKLQRLTISDTIIDAKIIDDQSLLVVKITANHYDYQVITREMILQTPALYHYPFEKEKSSPSLKKATISPQELRQKTIDYSPPRRLHFRQWSLFLGNGENTPLINTTITFTDPLIQNQLILQALQREEDHKDEFHLLYQNNAQLLSLLAGYHYHPLSRDDYHHSHSETFIGFRYPLWEKEFWHFQWQQEFARIYGFDHPWKSYSQLKLFRQKSYSLSFYPYHSFALLGEVQRDREGYQTSVTLNNRYDLGKEWFIENEALMQWSNTGDLYWGEALGREEPLIPTIAKTFSDHSPLKGYKLSLGIRKVLYPALYTTHFPIGVRRLIPHLFASRLIYPQLQPADDQEYGGGLETELLLAHRQPFPISFNWVKRDSDGSEKWGVSVNISF